MRIEPDFTPKVAQAKKADNDKGVQKNDEFDKMMKNERKNEKNEPTKSEPVKPDEQQKQILEKAMKENSKLLPVELRGKTEIPADFKMDKMDLLQLVKQLTETTPNIEGEAPIEPEGVQTPVTETIELPEAGEVVKSIEIPEAEAPAIVESVEEAPKGEEPMVNPVEGEAPEEAAKPIETARTENKAKENEKTEQAAGKVGLPNAEPVEENVKKEEKIANLVNKIKGDPDISNAIKNKLLEMVETKVEPENIIKELKSEITRVENQGWMTDVRETGTGTRLDSKMEIKDWVDRIKTELKYMVDFKVESENKIRLNLNNGDGFIRLNIEKINNEIIIHSDTSNSLRKRVDEILAEVRVEMRDKNVEVKFERERDKNERDERKEQNSKREEGGEQNGNGSNSANEQRRRSE